MNKKKLETFSEMLGGYKLEDDKEVEKGVTEVELSKLVPFENHPFKAYEGKKLDDLVESIKENGVITPIVIRPKGKDLFEILSGHNRVNAAKMADLEKIPCIIKEDLTDAEAKIIVTDTNFIQRSVTDMLPSELAKSLKMQLEACKEAKQKQELIKEIENNVELNNDRHYDKGAPVGHLQKSRDIIAKNNSMGRENIRRYISLNNLIEEILDMVDLGQISLRPAVDLSYLKQNEQLMIFKVIKAGNFKIDMLKAQTLRNLSESGKLTEDNFTAILSGEYNKKPKKQIAFKLKHKIISKYFKPEQNKAEIEVVIDKALALYFESALQKEDGQK